MIKVSMVKPKRREANSGHEIHAVLYEISTLDAMNSSSKMRPSASLDEKDDYIRQPSKVKVSRSIPSRRSHHSYN